jgi:uncharacterized protein YabE (DUF348 family)
MKPAHYRLLAAFLFLAGMACIGLSFRKQVVLADGEKRQSIITYALTTGQLLRLQDIRLTSQDKVSPPINHWLKAGEIITIRRAAAMTLDFDGEIRHLTSAERIPANLLASLEVRLYPGDQVWQDGSPVDPESVLPEAAAYALQVKRAISLPIQDRSTNATQAVSPSNLGEALWEAGIHLRLADQSSLELNVPIAFGGTGIDGWIASWTPAQAVTIQEAGQKRQIYTTASTVGAALAENGLAPLGLDYTEPGLDDPIPASRQIRLVRVQEVMAIEQTPLPYATKYEPAGDIELDTKKIIQPGQYGINAHRVRIRIEDGKEVSREVEGEWVASQPQDQIVGYGTLVVPHTLDTPEGPIQYWRAMTMWATSYHPSEVGKITASGEPLRKGVAAVDPYYVPMGTQLYVPDYGRATAADTGSGVRGRWIDLGYSDDDYVGWHQWVTVYFLWPPPANIQWMLP